MSRQGDKHWTAEQVEYLSRQWPLGEPADAISRLVGKTPKAVRFKAYRLGLQRPSESLPRGYKRCPRCERVKPLRDFYQNQSWCRSCYAVKREEWGKANRQYLAAYHQVRVSRNPEHMRAVAARGSHKQRAQMKDGHNLTEQEWQQILAKHEDVCPWCGRPFTKDDPPVRDCIVPVSRGGRLTMGNVQPLHDTCNASKGSRLCVGKV
jgi:hypothetical protein